MGIVRLIWKFDDMSIDYSMKKQLVPEDADVSSEPHHFFSQFLHFLNIL